MIDWPRKHIKWIENGIIFYSIPFTWNLPTVKDELRQNNLFQEYDKAIVGGPAVKLMPDFFNDMDWVSAGQSANGVMQKINPQATKTSKGCVRRCEFCAVPETEGNLKELKDWPNLPIITDNNLLACSKKHFNRVVDRLKAFEWTDFNQGIDSRLLKRYHTHRFAELKKPVIRLALDSMDYVDDWLKAYRLLRAVGLPKNLIRSYALIGFDTDPKECWQRCEYISSFKIKALPMWYHALNQLKPNIVTQAQEKLGWNDYQRQLIMGYYYRHRLKKERSKYYKESESWRKMKGMGQ